MRIVSVLFVLMLIVSCNQENKRVIEVQTEYGNMKFELFNDTPQHRDNIIKLANEGFYKDLLFHRVMQGFMIQGGDPKSKDAPANVQLGNGGPGYTVPAEIGHKHFKGALCAARMPDQVNPEKASSGSQFYIVQGTKVSDPQLNQTEQRVGITYTDEEKAKYKELGGYPPLDGGYTVFGQLIEGQDVIDKIASAKTNAANRPNQDVKMNVIVVK